MGLASTSMPRSAAAAFHPDADLDTNVTLGTLKFNVKDEHKRTWVSGFTALQLVRTKGYSERSQDMMRQITHVVKQVSDGKLSKEELAKLRTQFSEKYPDVVQLAAEIAVLERELANAKANESKPGQNPTSPSPPLIDP